MGGSEGMFGCLVCASHSCPFTTSDRDALPRLHESLPPLRLQVGPFDHLTIKGLTGFAPGSALSVVGKRPDGSTYEFPVNHTFNANQINVRGGGSVWGLGPG